MPPSQRERRSIEQMDTQIEADHAEGLEQMGVTRATARALYFALYDLLIAGEQRHHAEADLERLERLFTHVALVGWPEGAPDA
jgi:hypothetical protein